MNNSCLPYPLPPTMTQADGLFIKTYWYASLLRGVDCVMHLAPCLQTVSQACVEMVDLDCVTETWSQAMWCLRRMALLSWWTWGLQQRLGLTSRHCEKPQLCRQVLLLRNGMLISLCYFSGLFFKRGFDHQTQRHGETERGRTCINTSFTCWP